MKNKKIKNKLIKEAKKEKTWLAEAQYRVENKEWLDLSFDIAVKILRHLRKNNISQKDAAQKMSCSPQYLNKVLKGKENLSLESICKIENALGITLIKIPSFQNEVVLKYESNTTYSIPNRMAVLKKEDLDLHLMSDLFIGINYTNFSVA
jgi:transcriptional regulator with XRE-family HTH domain